MTTAYDFTAVALDGRPVPLADFRGKPLVVVNVASKCGFTGQYKGLENLYRQYHARGLEVLGFPCNQFMGQEPGDATEIQKFCSLKYDVTFPLFAKVEVNGPNAHPLYQWLKRERRGILWTTAVKWNFTKFLVNRDGRVVGRYGPLARPAGLAKKVEKLLGRVL